MRTARGGLHHELQRAKFEGTKNVELGGASGDRDDWRGLPGHQELEKGEAVHARHLDVERDEIRLLKNCELECVIAIRCFGDDFDVGKLMKDVAYRASIECRIVRHQHAEGPHRDSPELPELPESGGKTSEIQRSGFRYTMSVLRCASSKDVETLRSDSL